MGVRVGAAKIVGVRKGARVGATTGVEVGMATIRSVGGVTRVAVGAGIRVAVGAINTGTVAVGTPTIVALGAGTADSPAPPPQARPTVSTNTAIPAAAILNFDLPGLILLIS